MLILKRMKPLSNQYLKIATRSASLFEKVEMAPKDAIFGLHDKFVSDSDSKKVDLTVGSYKDDSGKSYVFPSVRKAEDILKSKQLKMDYLPIEGNPVFLKAATDLLYGAENRVLLENRVAAIQSLSGTGALRLTFEFIAKKLSPRKVYISSPTYANHVPLLESSGLGEIARYRYFDQEKNALDFDGMVEDLEAAPRGSVVLLQAVAHNPTGTDPTLSQWKAISGVCQSRGLLPVFDFAYQGFASGDPDADASAVRLFASDGLSFFVCHSFAKNFGLYGHRTGCLSIVASSCEEKNRLLSQLRRLVRTSYSNPPLHGARLVATVLGDPNLRAQWRTELSAVVARLSRMRNRLSEELRKRGSSGDWPHVTRQLGMFCYSGLTPSQVRFLRREWHVFAGADGRLSVPALTEANVAYVAEAMHAVSR